MKGNREYWHYNDQFYSVLGTVSDTGDQLIGVWRLSNPPLGDIPEGAKKVVFEEDE